MKTLNLLFFSLLLIGLITASCGDSNNSGCSDMETDQKESEVTAAQSALYDAQIAYANDNSLANCNTVANVWDDYLSKLSSFINCLEGPAKDAWQTAYALQVQERNTFSC